MTKKKYGVLVAVITILFISAIFAVTYAFLVGKTREVTSEGKSGKLDVIYNIEDNNDEQLLPSETREDGLKSIATARINTGSVPAKFNVYINPTAIEGLATAGLKWEVEGFVSGNPNPVYTNNGNFVGAVANTPIKIVNGYNLTTSDTTFHIYIWADINMLTDSMIGSQFTATIKADSVPIIGNVD